jgi:fibronectin-binding autotransporter adhesin
VTNSGSISGNSAGIFLNAGGTVNNLAGGTITGNGNDGVFVNNAPATVTNSGTIAGPDGVRFQVSEGTVPAGTVTNNAGGIIAGVNGVGVGTIGTAVIDVANTGTITGGIGILLVNGGTITNNAGATISGISGPAIQVIGAAANVSNAGNINGNVILDDFANSVTLLTGGVITGTLNVGSAAAATLTLDGAGSQLLSQAVTGTIGGFNSLTKLGTGTWVIDENLSYGGNTTIAAGTLQIGNGRTAGSIPGNVLNNGVLSFDRADAITFAGVISGGGSVTQNGPGAVTLTGANSYAGGTNLNAGIVAISQDTNLGTGPLNFNGGTLEILPAGGGIITGKAIMLGDGGGRILADSTTNSTLSGVISGFGGLVKDGAGQVTLTAANNYTGGTTILAGILQIGNGGATGSVVGNIANNGSLVFDRSDSVTFNGVISGAGSLTESGGGTLILTASNSYSGGTSINGGTIVVAADNALGTGIANVNDLSILRINPGVTVTNFVQINNTGGLDNFGNIQVTQSEEGPSAAVSTSGGATITNESGATISGVDINAIQSLKGPLSISNSGMISGIQGVVLGGEGNITNNANGVITGSSGIAIFASGGQTTLSNAGKINGNVILGDFANSVTLVTGGIITGTLNAGSTGSATLTLDGAGTQLLSQAVMGIIGGFKSLTKLGTGTWVIDENLSYGGSTTIAAGILQIGNGGTVGSIPGDVLNNGVLSFDRADAITFAGVISGSGSVAQNGLGTVTLTGTNSYAGGTNLNAGIVATTKDANLGTGPLNFNGGTLEILATGGGIITNKAITLGDGGGRLLADSTTNSTLSGVISGFGDLVKDGAGQVTLMASNTYSGGTSINGGTIVAAADSALGTGIVTVNDPSILRINPGVAVTNFVQINNTGTLDNFGTIQVTQTREGPLAAVTTSGGATITNESGATIYGVGINGIQSSNGSLSISNSGMISGIQGIVLGGDGNITNNANGVITGSSGIAILASGGQTSLYNAGTINGNVALGNSANSAQLITGSRINGVLDLGSNPGSILIFDGAGTQSVSQAVTGGIKNAGSLTKQGSGTWTIDTILNAPISTKVLDGILEVNGSLQSSNVTVQPGGTLKGVGNVVGNVLNFGTLSPGNSPGTLTVNGNFSQGPNGVFNVEILSAQDYSRLVVTGHASLDGTLHLTLASGFRPAPGESFTVLSARQGISGTFRTISSNTPVSVTYANGVVDVNTTSATQPAQKAQIHLSDGTPNSTTALLADYTFYGFGSLSERMALGLSPAEETGKNNAVSLTFDAGEFDFQGQHGQTYTIPIAGGFKINERVRLDYEIPLQYITLDRTALFQAGLTLDLPVKVIIPSVDQPWSWIVTPTTALASSGSREIIGGGALTNVFAYQWHGITATYGNYISIFEGDVLTSSDPNFPTGVSQQIMKNGLRLDLPIGKSWIVEGYGIYTHFFQSATVSSYVTFGAEVGHHFAWNLEGQNIDLGYLSLGMYSEIGNRYSSGHVQIGSAWRF